MSYFLYDFPEPLQANWDSDQVKIRNESRAAVESEITRLTKRAEAIRAEHGKPLYEEVRDLRSIIRKSKKSK